MRAPWRRGSPRAFVRYLLGGVLGGSMFVAVLARALGPGRLVAPAAPAAFAALVDLGGRRLYLECQGTGSPPVVLVAGYQNRADIWSVDIHEPAGRRPMVLPGVAGFTRVCAYDRPG